MTLEKEGHREREREIDLGRAASHSRTLFFHFTTIFDVASSSSSSFSSGGMMDRLRIRKQIANKTTPPPPTTRSPPKHRHDGSSPLPLGMDASPAPQQWNGLHTVWPHDARTGWSYCVTIPSWVVLSEAKNANGAFINPTVFYKVQVGIQSPQGYSTSSTILRRFSDFLKLSAALKRTLPKTVMPVAPPKNSLSRINSSHALLQERRCALEDWMGRLLLNFEISRSAAIASFLELESAARSAVNALAEVQGSSTSFVAGLPFENTSIQQEPSSQSALSWSCEESSAASGTLSAAYSEGSATPKATSEKGLDSEMEALVIKYEAEQNPMEGGHLKDSFQGSGLTGQTDKNDIQECDSKCFVLSDKELPVVDGDSYACASPTNNHEFLPPNNVDLGTTWHHRRPSTDSVISDMSLAMESDRSAPISVEGGAEGSLMVVGNMERLMESLPNFDPDFLKGIGVVLPMDQRGKVKKIVSALTRRFNVAKSDMEELLTRLNQETAMKDFLATKAQDLESELDSIRHKSRMVLQQAISAERDRVTDLQWEVEECRVALMNAEEALQSEQDGRVTVEGKLRMTESICESMRQQIAELHEKAECVQKDRDSSEAQARADMKVLAKEIKALRQNRQEVCLKEDREEQQRVRASRAKLLYEVTALHQRLKECSLDVLAREDNRSVALSNSMELLTTSDNRIGLLLAEAQLLSQEDRIRAGPSTSERALDSNGATGQEQDKFKVTQLDERAIDGATRKMLADILIDNALLRKSINSLARGALLTSERMDERLFEDPAIHRSVLNRLL
ncbi:hypothetical protein O6H91_07G051200 [Diphasiastrum complanatum]|uniref:Uncharacterized protein n=1 Tax=Diphasiastrum complanatum TaxID=34168 RepID=A0ACC2D576_DIPCM|nr:hypothetical protein O6H91_07G051200 [Diphasiastrum complanatum]